MTIRNTAVRTFTLIAALSFVTGVTLADEPDTATPPEKSTGANALQNAYIAQIVRAAESGNADAQFALGQLYDNGYPPLGITQDVARAVGWYTQAAERKNVDAAYALALLYMSDRDGVERDMQKAAALIETTGETHPSVFVLFGDFLVRERDPAVHNPEKALDFYKRAARNPKSAPIAQERLRQIRIINGFDETDDAHAAPSENLWLVQQYAAVGNKEKTDEFIAKANLTADRILYERAIMYVMCDKFDDARRIATTLRRDNPDKIEGHILLFSISLNEHFATPAQPRNPNLFDDMAAAVGALEKVLGKKSFLPPLLAALRHDQSGDYEAAAASFAVALENTKNSRHLILAIYETLRMSRSQNYTLPDLMDMACAFIDDPESADANIMFSSVFVEKELYTLAEHFLEKGLLDTRGPLVLNNLAWTKQSLGKLDQAEDLIREALGKNPGIPGAWDTLAWVLLKKGDLAGAEYALEQETLTARPEIEITYACLHLRKNEFDKARAYVNKIDAHDSLPGFDRFYYETLREIKAALDAQPAPDSATPAE